MTASQFLKGLDHPQREQMVRLDKLVRKLRPVTKAKLWDDDTVGYGQYSYTYKSGRTGEYFIFGFSPRKGHVSLYSMATEQGRYLAEGYRKKFGNLKGGKGCINVKDLDALDEKMLTELIRASFKRMQEHCRAEGWPCKM